MKKRVFCLLMTLVMFITAMAAFGEGILPSLKELDGTPLPSLGDVLHRYPDSFTPLEAGSSKENIQYWYHITEDDYAAYGQYLADCGATVIDYSTENDEMSVTIGIGESSFCFVYQPKEQRAIITYPKGVYDPRIKEAETHWRKARNLLSSGQFAEAREEFYAIPDYTAYHWDSDFLRDLELAERRAAGIQPVAQNVPERLDESKAIKLTFWAKIDTNKTQKDVYVNAIEEFQKLYPNVEIELMMYADYSRIFSDVIKNIHTNTLPNICITYTDHIATYLDGQDIVLQLDNWILDDQYGLGGSELKFDTPKEEEIVPEYLNECLINGHYYAMPFMRSTEAMYINQDMVEKLGYELPDVLTWDFVWEVSEKAMEKNTDDTFKINSQNVIIPFIWKSTDNMMITMLKQLSAPYSKSNGEVLIFNDVTRSLLKEIYTHAKSRAFSTFQISSYPGNFLNAGQCIFAVDSTAGATWMGGDGPMQDIHEEQIVHFNIAVRPVPQYDPDHLQMIRQGPSICIFNRADEQEVLASWLFVQYLLSNDVQLGYAETEGYVPVTLKAQQSAEYRDYLGRKGEDNSDHYAVKIEATELLLKHTADTFVTPVFNGSASLRSAAGQLIEETVKAARRNKEMNDSFIDEQFQKVADLYRLDQIQVSEAGAE